MKTTPTHRLAFLLLLLLGSSPCWGAGGTLTVSVTESDDAPTITRMEVWKGGVGVKPVTPRRALSAGFGVVVDGSLDLSLPSAAYGFRMIRGPEYRIVTGTFTLDDTSLDQHAVKLPRMVDMLSRGWTSGDCCAPASASSLPMRMAAEDLHLARTLGHVPAKPIAGRDRDDPINNEPSWISTDAQHHGGLVFYGAQTFAKQEGDNGPLPTERLATIGRDQPDARIAIENPFAWQLPIWLASDQIDGVFILGDWLQLNKRITAVKDGRGPIGPGLSDKKKVGRWAEQIYWNMLEAGMRIPPLAGSGDQTRLSPVGYNRLYVAEQLERYQQDGVLEARRVLTEGAWWDAAWRGRSVATNGPLLRPKLAGELPGHVFQATTGEVLELHPEVTLTVRDPVEYLEVVRNGKVHYSARLDQFAETGGKIPPMLVKESSWVTIRVVTLYEDHFRAAMSAPWYIDFDSKPRVTEKAVDFFRDWLSEYEVRLKRLPPDELARHVPFVRAARTFWTKRADMTFDFAQ